MPQVLNTLYVTNDEAYVRLDNDTLRVDINDEKKMQVPLHHITAVVCFGGAVMSLPAMCRCAEAGIAVVLLDRNGRFRARLEGPVSGNILLRQAQFAKAADPAFALGVAQAMLAGKIRNCRHLLLRGARDNRDRADDAAVLRQASLTLGHTVRKLLHIGDLDALRGAEGDAARLWFSCIPALLRPDARQDFAMDGRTRRPPLDRFNALISFIYALLMNDCRSALEAAGLDPQLGFLHAVRPGRAALALDLMEEFRSIWADRLALTLINRQQVKPDGFTFSMGGAVLIDDDTRRTVIVAYQERKQEEILHPLTGQKLPLGLAPMVQARLLARVIRGDVPGYVPFLAR